MGDSCEHAGGFREAGVEETGIFEGKRRNAGKASPKAGERAEVKDDKTQKQAIPDSVIEMLMEGMVSKTDKNHEAGDQHDKNLHVQRLVMPGTSKQQTNMGKDSAGGSTPPTNKVTRKNMSPTATDPTIFTISGSSRDTNGSKGEDTPEVWRLNSVVYKPWGSRSTIVDVSSDPQPSRQGKERVEEQDQAVCKGGPGKLMCGIQVKEGDDAVECERCMKWFHCKCQAILKTALTALGKWHGTLIWLCDTCTKSPKDQSCTPCRCAKIEDDVKKLEAMVRHNANSLKEVINNQEMMYSGQCKLMDIAVKTAKDGPTQKTYAEVMKGMGAEVAEQVSWKIEKMASEALHDRSTKK